MQNTATLSEALDQCEKYARDAGAVLASEGESFTGSIIRDPFATGGIPYDTYKEAHYKLETLKGKPTKKYFHVTITRLSKGSYEPVCYIL